MLKSIPRCKSLPFEEFIFYGECFLFLAFTFIIPASSILHNEIHCSETEKERNILMKETEEERLRWWNLTLDFIV